MVSLLELAEQARQFALSKSPHRIRLGAELPENVVALPVRYRKPPSQPHQPLGAHSATMLQLPLRSTPFVNR